VKRRPIRGEKWWVIAVQVPLRVLGYILSPLYAISFGALDKHLARKYERRLASDVQFVLRFLFTDYQGHVVPNAGVPFPPGFDYAFVTVAVANILLRFTRGRGELGVLLAPAFAPADWHDLSLVLAAIHDLSSLERQRYHDLWHLASKLEPHMKTLIENCTVQRFTKLKQRLQNEVYAPEAFVIRQWETETNARLYGPR
jgi:hypothetical protein